MIQTEIKSLEDALLEAISLAKAKDAPQLLSVTEKIHSIDPVMFYANAKDMKGERVFWASAVDDFYLVGVGQAYTIKAEADRYEQTESLWQKLLAESIILNPYKKPGTGPLAMGGFSFDPDKKDTKLWKDFGGSQFRVPAYLLTIVDGNCYLTINTIVQAEDHAKQLIFNINKNKHILLGQVDSFPQGPTIKQKLEIDPKGWKQLVEKATDNIKQELVDKIVLAREMHVVFEKEVSISPVINKLLQTQPNSYVFSFENGQSCFIGATPERLVHLQDDRLLSTCLAGTAPRGHTREEDQRLGTNLLNDIKNRQEHQFVVEMISNAISECCVDVVVPQHPVLYPLKNLQHLYTPVEGTLKKGFTIIDVVKRLHPTPALGGLPREKSLAFIRDYEKMDRGWYGSPIGWLDAYQNGEFAVAIRSALINGKEASLFAGCGVVKDSDPDAEFEETTIKFTPMLSVLGG